jgi:hypothetical protein
MAGLSAGEVFVNLVVKGDGVKPALSKASAAVKEFGKGISAASVATGTLIADVARSAFGAMGSLGKGALDRAIVSPKTAKGLQDLQRSLYMITENMKKWGVTIISLVLPYLNMLASAALSVVNGITEFISSMEQSGVVAAIQTGNIFAAFELMFTQIKLYALEAMAPIIAPFVGLAKMILDTFGEISSGVQVVFDYIKSVFTTFGSGIGSGFTQLAKMFEGFAGGVMAGWQVLSKAMLSMFFDVVKQTGESLKGLVIGLKVISPALASQLGPLEAIADTLAGIKPPALTMGATGFGNLFQGLEEGFAAIWEQAGAQGNEVIQEQINKMRERVNSLSAEMTAKREEVTQAGEASLGFINAQKGFSGTSSIITGSGSNVMFQTQKDLLREAKEQKDLAKKQLEQQIKIAKQRGAVFVQ